MLLYACTYHTCSVLVLRMECASSRMTRLHRTPRRPPPWCRPLLCPPPAKRSYNTPYDNASHCARTPHQKKKKKHTQIRIHTWFRPGLVRGSTTIYIAKIKSPVHKQSRGVMSLGTERTTTVYTCTCWCQVTLLWISTRTASHNSFHGNV